jgi:hypothetical protein
VNGMRSVVLKLARFNVKYARRERDRDAVSRLNLCTSCARVVRESHYILSIQSLVEPDLLPARCPRCSSEVLLRWVDIIIYGIKFTVGAGTEDERHAPYKLMCPYCATARENALSPVERKETLVSPQYLVVVPSERVASEG